MSVDEDGNFGYAPLVRAIYAALLELEDGGFLTSDETLHMAIPTVARSRADFLAPFETDGCFAGLCVEELETFYGEDGIWLDYERQHNVSQFAAQWAAFSRASVFPTLAGNLGSGGGPRAVDFCDRLEAGTAARLADAPERMQIPLVRILLAKAAVVKRNRLQVQQQTPHRTGLSPLIHCQSPVSSSVLSQPQKFLFSPPSRRVSIMDYRGAPYRKEVDS